MIDFEAVWLPQIVGYARLIASGQLEDEWLGRAPRSTSVTDPYELCEHVFGDLDAENIWAENRDRPDLSLEARAGIDKFLDELKQIDEPLPQALIASSLWTSAKKAANLVISHVA